MTYKVKIIKIGNSLGFIVPKPIVKALKLKVGQKVYTDYDTGTGRLTYYFDKADYEKSMKENAEFQETIRRFNENYKDILAKLKR